MKINDLYKLPPFNRSLPLKEGIYEDILARYPDINQQVLRQFIQGYVVQFSVLKNMISTGSKRYDLDGNPCGGVNIHSRKLAQKIYFSIKQDREYQKTLSSKKQSGSKPDTKPKQENAPTVKNEALTATIQPVLTVKANAHKPILTLRRSVS